MKVIRCTDTNFSQRLREVTAPSSLFDPVIEQRTRAILDAVQARGDDALLEFTEKFDGAKLATGRLAVTQAELMTASLKANELLRTAVAEAESNITGFAKKSLRKNWQARNSHGATVGEKFDPFQRVGVYIPGGKAPLASTALMTITLAKVAGCPEIVACTPCGRDGAINAALLYATRAAGATEIYRVGGAQAVAAMAYGTKTIRRVQKIFGPGNAYVVAAKRLLVGHVAIDLLPGPSELLVLADDTANPKFIAADLLAQAEHGSGLERVWLVTNSEEDFESGSGRNCQTTSQTGAPRIHPTRARRQQLADPGGVTGRRRGPGEPARPGALRGDDAQSTPGFRRDFDGGRDFPRALVANGAGRLCGRAEPHAADRRRRSVVCRPDRGPVSTPHQRGRIQPRVAENGFANSKNICRTGRLGRAREKCGDSDVG